MSNILIAAKELEKVAKVQAHLALHRYVSSSASPNEINYLKSIGLIPRSGKKNRGQQIRSQKHAIKTAAMEIDVAESGIYGAITGGVLGGAFSPKGLRRPGALAGAALTGGGLVLSGILHNKSLKERDPVRKKVLSAASGLSGIAAVLGMYLAPLAVLKRANKKSLGKGFANFFDERAIRVGDSKLYQSMVSAFKDAKAREAAKVVKFPTKKARRRKVPQAEQKGEVIQFSKNPGMWKNSCVFSEFFEEFEKIASAGRTLVGDPKTDTGLVEFTVPTFKHNKITGKLQKTTAKAAIESMGRAVSVGSTTPLTTVKATEEPDMTGSGNA